MVGGSPQQHLVFLSLAWIAYLLFNEVLVYIAPTLLQFPSNKILIHQIRLDQKQHFNNNNEDKLLLFRMAVIADPQLTDHYSYRKSLPTAVIPAIEFISDLFMRRSFQHIVLPAVTSSKDEMIDPHVMFLGDLFDGGSQWAKHPKSWGDGSHIQSEQVEEQTGEQNEADTILSDATEYLHEIERFNSIFTRHDKDKSMVKFHFMAGNHDIGFGDGIIPEAAVAFSKTFAKTKLNYQIDDGNGAFRILVVNTMALEISDGEGGVDDDEGAKRRLVFKQQAQDFIKEASTTKDKNLPTILFSHVPLYRESGTNCNPPNQEHQQEQQIKLRMQSKSIEQGRGFQYQNLISPIVSESVLSALHPSFVFSGDDHDFCLVEHSVGEEERVVVAIPEMTVPTFSWLQGNDYPSFALLKQESCSPSTSSTSSTSSNNNCLNIFLIRLPRVKNIYLSYSLFALISLCLVIIFALRRTRRRAWVGRVPGGLGSFLVVVLRDFFTAAFSPLLLFVLLALFF